MPHFPLKKNERRFSIASVCHVTLTLLVALTCASAAHAQSPSVKRELTIPPAAGKLENLVQFVAPAGRCAALTDESKMLAVAHHFGVVPHVSIFSLNEKGEISDNPPKQITLPCPEKLAPRKNYPLALTTHPSLPLLYVWQDIQLPDASAPPEAANDEGFSHLLIYDLEADPPALVQSVAGGEDYAHGNRAGAIEFDFTGSRIFIPNLRHKLPKGTSPAIGFLRVSESGLVTSDAEDASAADKRPTGKKGADKQDGAVKLAARKAYLESIKKGKVASREVRSATNFSATFAGYPCGLSFFPVSEQVTLVGGPLGPVTWDESNRRAQFNSLTFYPLVGAGYLLRLAGHPELPVAYLSGISGAWLYRIEHVDGFPTLMPQRATLTGAKISSPPIVMATRKQVVVGGANAVHVVGIDDVGALTNQRIDVPVNCASVEALVYSKQFDRLYVAVDKQMP